MANQSTHTKLVLNPSAPDFSPEGFFELKVEATTPATNSTESRNISSKTPTAVWDNLLDGLDMTQPAGAKCLKPQKSIQIPYSSSDTQQRLERLVYFTTRDIFMQSPFSLITRLSANSAIDIIKRHLRSSHLELLLRQYKMDELVETMVEMHAKQIYISTPDSIKKTWPWLLNGNVSELATIETTMPQDKTNQSNKIQPSSTLEGRPNNMDWDKRFSPNTLLTSKNLNIVNAYTHSVLDDEAGSIMSFDPSGEALRSIDPDNIYFPYPTLRAILKETRRILKAAFYEFTKSYLPEKLNHKAFEFPDNSSLGQIILMVQDTMNHMDNNQFPAETFAKLARLRDIDSNTDCLNSASELYDLVSRRRNISISGLYPLLTNILNLVDALGASNWSKKQRALNKYTSVLTADIQQKFEKIQGPIRTTLERINNQREALAVEEELVTQKYRQDEKEIQRHFILDSETLRGIILSRGSAASYPGLEDARGDGAQSISIIERPTPHTSENTKQQRVATDNIETSIAKISNLPAPPDICVWDPQKQLIDYRPSGSQLQSGTQNKKRATRRRPWDVASIDLALDELNSKENIYYAAKKASQNITEKGKAGFQTGLQSSRHTLEVVVPSKQNKAIPIKKIEEPTQKPNHIMKAEPMPKYNPHSMEDGKGGSEIKAHLWWHL
ncbi:hypothetical protein TWF102_001092 [Orbilia oligospora]|uniref:Uncharacterized protein n=1 Tax=Orbilia oligospora TaxID=2813651 RepID=A0A7C8JXT8_ORBOL|nr:hypothetical protein TWF102_001092 [Orbilia oligospora]KAF3092222.1 hypothetical protein TWF706_009067 [Orbilia oligospora]KAF3096934.1 hypothetical protein TWF103_009702 [Orbilia oligospora]KAF3138896.1 hypothetical protein TWF703_004437 [Orbilia oligospora]